MTIAGLLAILEEKNAEIKRLREVKLEAADAMASEIERFSASVTGYLPGSPWDLLIQSARRWRQVKSV
jgi:hypothetical protein